MSNLAAKVEQDLSARRQPDGGFAATAEGSSSTEGTALALLALGVDTENGKSAAAWLLARQHSDGAWPLSDVVPEPSWASAWALLALVRAATGSEPLARAVSWLSEREGARPSMLARALARVSGGHKEVEHDFSLRGWPWHTDAASWAEPTASALLALRCAGARVELGAGRERIAEGERLLWNRMCVDGGWNYGNRRVFGEALPPFPDTTALVLIALQGSPRGAEIAQSFAALDALLAERASSLALALGALAAELQGRDAARYRGALAERIERRGPPAETRALAFALLALAGGAEALRVPS